MKLRACTLVTAPSEDGLIVGEMWGRLLASARQTENVVFERTIIVV